MSTTRVCSVFRNLDKFHSYIILLYRLHEITHCTGMHIGFGNDINYCTFIIGNRQHKILFSWHLYVKSTFIGQYYSFVGCEFVTRIKNNIINLSKSYKIFIMYISGSQTVLRGALGVCESNLGAPCGSLGISVLIKFKLLNYYYIF